MIKSFKNKKAEKIWNNVDLPRIDISIQNRALRKLHMINAASEIETLRVPPGNRLEKLSGDRRGQWSVRVNDQWRICFKFKDGNAEEVELVDYH